MDDVRSLFDDAGDRVAIPRGDLAEVVRSGRARRRRRLVTGVASAVVVAVAAWGAAAILGGREPRPVPVTPDEVHRSGERLVPGVTEGPSPFPELASADELADARAITVAFHAFLEGTGRRYDFDYEGFGDSDGKWWVRFAQLSPPSPEEGHLRRLHLRLEAQAGRLRAEHAELGGAVRALRERDRTRRVRRQIDSLRDSRRGMRRQVTRLERQMAQIQRRRRRLLGHPLPYRTEVTVVERDGILVVEDVETDSPEAAALMSTIGFARPEADVDAWGADYYDATFRPRRGSAEGVVVEALGFWTGPLHSPYEERCRPQVSDLAGEVVWTGPLGVYETAPRRDEIRDRLRIELGFRYDGDVGDLSLRMLCEWRPRQ